MLNYTVLTILALVVLYPLLGITTLAFQPSDGAPGRTGFLEGFSLDTFARAWNQGSFGLALRNSAIVATAVTLIATTVSVLAGYAFGALRVPYSTPIFFVFMLGLIVPQESYITPLYYQLGSYGLLDTFPGLILPTAAHLIPFGIFWMRATFLAMPVALFEAARVDGAGSFLILRSILLPLARPATAVLVVLTFLYAWNDFLLALVVVSGNDLRTAPLQLGLFIGQRLSDIPALAAAAVIVSVPVVIIYVALQRDLIEGILSGAIKE